MNFTWLTSKGERNFHLRKIKGKIRDWLKYPFKLSGRSYLFILSVILLLFSIVIGAMSYWLISDPPKSFEGKENTILDIIRTASFIVGGLIGIMTLAIATFRSVIAEKQQESFSNQIKIQSDQSLLDQISRGVEEIQPDKSDISRIYGLRLLKAAFEASDTEQKRMIWDVIQHYLDMNAKLEADPPITVPPERSFPSDQTMALYFLFEKAVDLETSKPEITLLELDLNSVFFRNCTFDSVANIHNTVLDNSRFLKSYFCMGKITNCTFRNAQFDKAIFNGLNFDGCDFDGAKFNLADFTRCDLSRVRNLTQEQVNGIIWYQNPDVDTDPRPELPEGLNLPEDGEYKWVEKRGSHMRILIHNDQIIETTLKAKCDVKRW